MRPDQGAARLLRLTVFTAATLALAAGAHALGGGPVGASALALAAVPVALVATALSARRVRGHTLLAVLAAEQAALHVAFHALHGHASAAGAGPAPAGHGAACHAHAGATHTLALSAGGGADVTPSPGMLAFHVVATLVTAWLMARGEDALWREAARLRIAWRGLPVTPRPVPAAAPAPPPVGPAPRVWRPRAPLPQRGPPVGAAAL